MGEGEEGFVTSMPLAVFLDVEMVERDKGLGLEMGLMGEGEEGLEGEGAIEFECSPKWVLALRIRF